MATPKVLLVGCGKMGGAMLQRIAHETSVCVVDPQTPSDSLKMLSGVAWMTEPSGVDARFTPDVVLIAIKPQEMSSVLPQYSKYRDSLFISVAAGQTLLGLASILGGNFSYPIVRVAPSILASIGESMTVGVANGKVSPAHRTLCERIFNTMGKFNWVEDEGWIDTVTALAGSGPAYVFALVDAMAKAAEALDLPHPLAIKLARQTVIGSGMFLAAQPADTPQVLRAMVSSPGGATEAALKQLLASSGGLNDLMAKAVKAAAHRAKDLAR